MPSDVKQQDITEKNDPSVMRQWDEADFSTKFEEFYKIVDGLKIGLLGTYRPGVGPVTRSMALAKRTGPDFLFLSNNHSQKFKDIEAAKEVNVSFQDTKTQDWISVSGTATTSNSDPRIKEIWSRGAAAWFGDLGDGVHDGSATDPRMSLIEVKSKYISYYSTKVGAVGYLKEVVAANVTGGVANTGNLRQMKEDEIAKARKEHSPMSS
ncbi:blue light-inducible protein-like protein Bli-3 [Aureobasidium sp. EXF-12298]|nr:blue light-inducible protein-like protein Bli-3 [Aureobasidium sp. EXF-12298]KAI4755864.1 blue light-inducible protein-like protein Bli-3 [Aureobasidium sp. EXF-12344]KAI4772950.1 blue light-inducible protein-like protein Bli-3 [Aureobasidium sp. EXF-3400]